MKKKNMAIPRILFASGRASTKRFGCEMYNHALLSEIENQDIVKDILIDIIQKERNK